MSNLENAGPDDIPYEQDESQDDGVSSPDEFDEENDNSGPDNVDGDLI